MPRPFGTTGHQALTAAPAVGPAGATYYDSTLKLSFLSDGTKWIEVSSEYIASRGPGLITNGSALLGTNYNWTTFYNLVKFDHPVGAAGCFETKNVNPHSTVCDEFIPVDPAGWYDMTFAYRQAAGDAARRFYSLILPHDADKLSIIPYSYMEQVNTRTTLAVDLKTNDTTITLTSAANWNNAAGSNTYLRTIIIWNYTDGQGYAWPPYTYSRNYRADAWADGGISGNVITLRTPWTGATVPAGTPVSNGSAGGNYMYGAASLLAPTVWTNYSYRYGGVHSNNLVSATSAFPISTSYVKVGFLHNYTTTDPTAVARVSNINLTQVSAVVKQGLPAGGTANQVLSKKTTTDYDTQWVAPDSPPTGAAGGDLAGTYPNPQIAAGTIVDADVAVANKDGTAGTPSLRTLGSGAQQALAGNTRLDQLPVPTAAVNANSQKITNLADPTVTTDAANKVYVDKTVNSVSCLPGARVVSTTQIGGVYNPAFPATMTLVTNVIDGVTLSVGDIVLVTNQTIPKQHGPWRVTTVGTGADGVWNRPWFFGGDLSLKNVSNPVSPIIPVAAGTVNKDTLWMLTNDSPYLIDTDNLTWVKLGASGPAGGVLAGTYPNPTIAPQAIMDADVNNTAEINQYKISGLVAALAAKATAEDTGWINLTPTVGTGVLAWRCVNGTVAVKGNLTGLSVATGANQNIAAAGVIPAAYRPSTSVYAVSNGAGNAVCTATVGTDGSVSLWNSWTSTVTVFRCNFTWLKE